jgi:hypothetical protein
MSGQTRQVFPAQQLPPSVPLEQTKQPMPYKPSNTSDEQGQDITEDLHADMTHGSASEDPLTPLLNDDEVPLASNDANSTSKLSSPQKSTFSRLSIDEEKSVSKLLSFDHCH